MLGQQFKDARLTQKRHGVAAKDHNTDTKA